MTKLATAKANEMELAGKKPLMKAAQVATGLGTATWSGKLMAWDWRLSVKPGSE